MSPTERPRISLRQIEGFQLASEHLSFSRATAQLGIRQSDFSQLIRELETLLGVELFDRTTRKVVLTAAGEAMRLKTRRGLDAIDDACKEAIAIGRADRGHIRAVCSQVEGKRDAVFEYLLDDELMLVTPRTGRLARQREVQWSDLADEPLVRNTHVPALTQAVGRRDACATTLEKRMRNTSASSAPGERHPAMTTLFDPFTLRGVTLRHRLVISPMCTYRAGPDGRATDWHFAHYARFAFGGAAMVMTEATSVAAEGRHCYSDLGIWEDGQIAPLRRIAEFLKAHDCVPAIQLQHAGRKASARRPWDGAKPLDEDDARLRGEPAWPVMGPSPIPYAEGAPVPREMDQADIRDDIEQWVQATRRAVAAGFEVLEVHAAHGYLINQFLSPLANQRQDAYGGDLAGRMRFALELIEAVRAAWPQDKPLLVRVSAVDSGWSMDDTVALARALKAVGVDAIDCSSGGIGGPVVNARVPRGPGFQVPFAERVRQEAGLPSIAVGLITEPQQAAEIVENGRADLVAIGREALVNPNWVNQALTQMQPQGGYAHWPAPSGWWLDRRNESIAASRRSLQQ
jgi:2,4-dienoyl-CoA reductase-like NADH-dependent reductase (Old Yellow Enzyme family)